MGLDLTMGNPDLSYNSYNNLGIRPIKGINQSYGINLNKYDQLDMSR